LRIQVSRKRQEDPVAGAVLDPVVVADAQQPLAHLEPLRGRAVISVS